MTKINVKVKAMNGQQIELQVEPEIEVEDFRKLLAEKSSTSPNQQRLIYQGRVLKNGTKLSDYKISNDHVIHLVNMPPPEAQNNTSGSSSSTTTNTGATTNQTPSANTGAHPHAQAFRALGPGMVITGIVDSQQSPNTNNNQRGGIDISSILNSVLGGILQPPNNANNHGHSHPHPHNHNQQPRQQQQQQQATNNNNNNNNTRQLINGARSIINLLNNEQQRQTVVRSLESIVTSLSESTPNRLAANLARNEIVPTLQQLQRDVGAVLNPRSSNTATNNTGAQGTTHSEPGITGVNLNLHVNANELDQLPNQLDRLHNIIHNSPLAPRPQTIVEQHQPILITTSTTTVNRDSPAQQPQQTTPQQPTQTTSATTTQPTSTASTQQTPNIQQNSLNSFMERAMTSMGLSLTETNETERSVFDRLISVATDGLQITDLLGIISGNWGPLESTKGRMRDFVVTEVLKGDTSSQNLQEKVEEIMTDFEGYLDKNHDLQLEIASRAGEYDVIDLLTQIVRNYVTLFFKLIIEEPDKYHSISNGTIDGTVQSPFASALNRFTTLALGEVVELFETHCTSGSSSVLLPLLMDSMFNSLPSNVQIFYRTQGSSVIASFAAQRHQQYKNLYPNRSLTFMAKPIVVKKESKPVETINQEVKKEEPQSASDSDKLLEELMSKDSMDLLDSVSLDDFKLVEEKPVVEASKSTPVEQPKPVVAEKPKSPTPNTSNNDWKGGLSEEEIKEINETIEQDQAIMELTADETQKVSDSYKMSSTQSGYVKKEKEPNTGGAGVVSPPSKQEDEDVDLD